MAEQPLQSRPTIIETNFQDAAKLKTSVEMKSPTSFPTKYPMELGTPGPFEKWIMFSARSSRHVGRRGFASEADGQTDRTLASVQLYVPTEALNSQITATYDTNDLGPFMGVLSEASARRPELISAFKGIGAVADDLVNLKLVDAATKAIGAGGDILKGVKNAAIDAGGGSTVKQAALAKVLQMAAEKFEGAVPQALGVRPNPRTDVLFSHVGYRTHRMDFMLIPRNEDEARAIDRIIKFFQFYMLPAYSPAVGTNQNIEGMLMGFPYEFEISFWSQSTPSMHHFNKIGRSVLQNVSVDHAGGSQVAFFRASNGELFPAVTKLSLEFQEVRLLARDEESADTSPSSQGLIDRGNVGNFPDPGRDRLADIAKKLNEQQASPPPISGDGTPLSAAGGEQSRRNQEVGGADYEKRLREWQNTPEDKRGPAPIPVIR